MSLKEVVNVNITSDPAGVTRAGFGIPLILTQEEATAPLETVQYVSSTEELRGCGYTAGSPADLAVATIFMQNPCPQRVAVARLSEFDAKVIDGQLTLLNEQDSGWYFIRTVGIGNSSSMAADVQSAADDADAYAAAAATARKSNAAQAATAAKDAEDAKTAKGTADDSAKVVTDAIETASHGAMPFQLNIATWAEGHEHIYICDTSDPAVVDTTYDEKNPDTDIASKLKHASYGRTFVVYEPARATGPETSLADAWVGKRAPADPGSETWTLARLTGVEAPGYTTDQRTHLRGKNCTFFETIAGVSVTQGGLGGAGEHLDVIRFRDWLKARISEDVFGLLSSVTKVPYTDAGIALVLNAVRAVLEQGIRAGGITTDEPYVLTARKARDIPKEVRATRVLPDIEFSAPLAGAIHVVDINGRITV